MTRDGLKGDFNMMHRLVSFAIGSVLSAAAAFGQLQNPSFELPGTTTTFANWVSFDSSFPEFSIVRTGAVSLKAFGNFTTAYNTSGAYQDVATAPGQSWQASVWALSSSTDPMQAGNVAAINIEWRDASNTLISYSSATAADSTTIPDVWHQATVTGTAPAGAVTARLALLFVQGPALLGGSAYFDDAQMSPTIISGVPNASFEQTGTGGQRFQSWTNFGNVFSDGLLARTGTAAAKMFGNWSGPYNATGVFQDFPAHPNQAWTGSAWAATASTDRMQPSNFAAINIEWHDAANNLISFITTQAADAATTPDVWHQAVVSGVAPAGTVTARIVLLHIQGPEQGGGAVWWDDVLFAPSGPTCGSADFNGDGDTGTDADIEAFFACLSGNCCARCGTSDFNGDGDVGTDADIGAFFRVLGGGAC